MASQGTDTGWQRRRLGGRGRVTSSLVGLAGGVGVNLLSTTLGYRGFGVLAAAAAVVAGTTWLRQLPPRAPLVRYGGRVLLTLAGLVVLLTVLVPRSWVGAATVAAAGLVGAAVLIPSDLVVSVKLLLNAVAVGFTVVALGGAIATLPRHATMPGGIAVAMVGMPLLLIPAGLAVLHGSDRWLRAALAVLGLVLVSCAIGALQLGAGVVTAVAYLGAGLLIFRYAVFTRGRSRRMILRWSNLTAAVRQRRAVLALAFFCVGVPAIVLAAVSLTRTTTLFRVTLGAFGVGLLGLAVVHLRDSGLARRLGQWLVRLTQEEQGPR